MIFFIVVGLYVVSKLGIHSWLSFLIAAIIYTILYYLCAYGFMMNAYERELFTGFFAKIFNKIKR